MEKADEEVIRLKGLKGNASQLREHIKALENKIADGKSDGSESDSLKSLKSLKDQLANLSTQTDQENK